VVTLVKRCLPLLAGALCALAIAPAAWAADQIQQPDPLTIGTAFQEFTGNYNTENNEPNTLAPFPQQCDSGHNTGVARTSWYTVRGDGQQLTVSTNGSDFDTALFVYTGSANGTLVGCSDDAPGLDVASLVTFASTAGTTYFVQVGVACNETGPPTCQSQPASGTVNVLATSAAPAPAGGGTAQPPSQPANPRPAVVDADRDGSPAGADCNDASAAIHPGAIDVPGNRVDEDCSGADAAFPRLAPTSSIAVTFGRNFTKILTFTIAGAPAGSTIGVACSSKKRGCPFSSKTLAVRSARSVSLAKLFKKAKLRRNAIVSVRVTRPGFIGRVFNFRLRNRQSPARSTQCLAPGASKPQATCP
jgi:hypothetical protein